MVRVELCAIRKENRRETSRTGYIALSSIDESRAREIKKKKFSVPETTRRFFRKKNFTCTCNGGGINPIVEIAVSRKDAVNWIHIIIIIFDSELLVQSML